MAKEQDMKQLVIGTVFSEWKHSLQELLKEHISLAKSKVSYNIAKEFGEDYQPEEVDYVIRRFGRTLYQIKKNEERCIGFAKICNHWLDTFNFVIDLFDPEKKIVNGNNYEIRIPKLLFETIEKEDTSDKEIKNKLLKHMKQLSDKVSSQSNCAQHNYKQSLENIDNYKNSEDSGIGGFDPHVEMLGKVVEKNKKDAQEQRDLNTLFKETYEYLLDKIL